MNYWSSGTRARGAKEFDNVAITERPGEKRRAAAASRRDHRAETRRTTRFAGWKLVIKIPAVALARENDGREERTKREKERETPGGVPRPADSCVRTSAAFKPRSAFKLAIVPIRAYVYIRIHTYIRTTEYVFLRAIQPAVPAVRAVVVSSPLCGSL